MKRTWLSREKKRILSLGQERQFTFPRWNAQHKFYREDNDEGFVCWISDLNFGTPATISLSLSLIVRSKWKFRNKNRNTNCTMATTAQDPLKLRYQIGVDSLQPQLREFLRVRNPLNHLTEKQRALLEQVKQEVSNWELGEKERQYVDDMCCYRFVVNCCRQSCNVSYRYILPLQHKIDSCLDGSGSWRMRWNSSRWQLIDWLIDT